MAALAVCRYTVLLLENLLTTIDEAIRKGNYLLDAMDGGAINQPHLRKSIYSFSSFETRFSLGGTFGFSFQVFLPIFSNPPARLNATAR